VRFGLASWFRRPCSRAPSHETVFFFALASAFFFSISFVFHRLVTGGCVVAVEALVLSLMSKQKNSRNKNCGCLVSLLACRLQSLAALLFCSLRAFLLFGTE